MVNHSRRNKRSLIYSLIVILAVGPAANAQTTSQPATIRDLKVVPLTGNQEMNDLQNKVMAPLVVEVRDQNDRPVEGADVTFRFPLNGPSAVFPGQNPAATFKTNADGQAAAIGWVANGQVGTFKVQVTAFRGGEEGAVVISMTNVTRITEAARTREKRWWSTKWGRITIIAGVAVVAATAAILATRGGSGSTTKVITASPGSPTIGAPQ